MNWKAFWKTVGDWAVTFLLAGTFIGLVIVFFLYPVVAVAILLPVVFYFTYRENVELYERRSKN